jgi:hypothetical protein
MKVRRIALANDQPPHGVPGILVVTLNNHFPDETFTFTIPKQGRRGGHQLPYRKDLEETAQFLAKLQDVWACVETGREQDFVAFAQILLGCIADHYLADALLVIYVRKEPTQ